MKYTNKFLNISNERILKMCMSRTEDDESEIISNSYFKIFCQNEYDIKQFRTNYSYYLYDILEIAGFEISFKNNTAKTIDNKKKF
jgi:hypothetical protein